MLLWKQLRVALILDQTLHYAVLRLTWGPGLPGPPRAPRPAGSAASVSAREAAGVPVGSPPHTLYITNISKSNTNNSEKMRPQAGL